jgi:hypothetical protein
MIPSLLLRPSFIMSVIPKGKSPIDSNFFFDIRFDVIIKYPILFSRNHVELSVWFLGILRDHKMIGFHVFFRLICILLLLVEIGFF